MLATCDGFSLLLHNLAFGKVSEMNGSTWFVAISVSRQSVSWYRVLNIRNRCISIHLIFRKVSIVVFNGRRDIWLCSIICRVQCWDWRWDSWMFCSIFASRDALLGFGRLVWSVMDLMVLLFFCGCFWIIFSKKRQCWLVLFDLLQYQHQVACFSCCVLKIQIRSDWIHYFQRSFDWGFQFLMRY